MKTVIVETKIDSLKPKMKVLERIEDIPLPCLLSAKADGDFEYLHYNRLGFSFTTSQAYILNKWGRLRTEFPALQQFIEAMNQTHINEAEFLCELYAKDGDKPLILPHFIHALKGNPPQHNLVHLGIFDILTLDGQQNNDSYRDKYALCQSWFKICTHANVLPFTSVQTPKDVFGFWKLYVKDLHYEGVVVRTDLDTYKVKPFKDIDAVIIGINKKSSYGKTNLFAMQQVTSLKLALMQDKDTFVEIGDCASGIDHQLRRSLWKLMDYKIAEDDKVAWIKPFVIVTVAYTDLFRGRNTALQLTPTGYRELHTTPLIRMKSPRLMRFRKDKQATPQDLSVQQIPQEHLAGKTT